MARPVDADGTAQPRRSRDPLPIEVRQLLWRRFWDRLLLPPPDYPPRDDRTASREERSS